MTKPMSPEGFFGAGGAPSFKFAKPGDTVAGKITDLKVVQQTKYNPNGGAGDPLSWPNGDPMMQLNITLQTELRDPSIEDDDGKRRVYVQGKRLRNAVQDAFRAVGAPYLEIGGSYTQTFTGYDPESKNPDNPAKLYKVTYLRPNASAEFFNGATPTGGQVGQAPEPAATPIADALEAALANLSPEAKAAVVASLGKTG